MGIVSEIEPNEKVKCQYRPIALKRSLSACEFRLRKSLQNLNLVKSKEQSGIVRNQAPANNIEEQMIRLENLKGLRTIGEGAFSEVKLVKDLATNKAYALKIQSRKFLEDNDLEDLAENEINIMKELSHPFIIQLHQTFRDSRNLYMLLEYVPGGELFSLIGRKGRHFDIDAHRFYAACVLSALEAMHLENIVFRDLKPENILIDAQGYLKLVDFGFAKKLDGRTYTPCGTPEYFSPELIIGTGYGKGNDIWSFGVLLYEIIFGRNPFSRYGEKKAEICRKIVYSPLKFRNVAGDKLTRDFLCGLLEKKEAKRLGCGAKGATELKSNPWFADFNWEELFYRKMKAPWVPSLIGSCDSTYFAEYCASNDDIPRNLYT